MAGALRHLPAGITFPKGYRVKVRIIHELDQFAHGIEPVDVDLWWRGGTPLDLWDFTVDFAPGAGHFGQEGTYLYRYQLLRGDQIVTTWFADPFGRANGFGGVSAFTIDANTQPFPWKDGGFSVPEVDDLVVYELHVAEFNRSFDGVTAQIDYLAGLGVNTLELMPVTDVKEEVEWGYTPLGYFAPDERFGGVDAFKRLVDAAHTRGIAVIIDAVYAHAHPEFAYNIVYFRSGEANPMMGRFAEEFFSWAGTDYRKAFTRDYFLAVNRHWLTELHVDGFRYDYVPGMYDGPVGVGYAQLVFETHRLSQDPALRRFAGPDGRSKIIQCAEHLPGPQEILSKTYSNTCWQNRLLDLSIDMARRRYVSDAMGHQLDPEFNGYPSEFFNPPPASGSRSRRSNTSRPTITAASSRASPPAARRI